MLPTPLHARYTQIYHLKYPTLQIQSTIDSSNLQIRGSKMEICSTNRVPFKKV